LRLIALSAAICVSACASYNPIPLEDLSFKDRAQTEEQGGLKVSVSVLGREEAQQAFGVNLQKRGIQPVWLEVENRTDKNFWLMMTGLDPNYFSAHEAAYMNHFRFGGRANKDMDAYFSSLGIDQRVLVGETNSGFAFANETVGTKEIRVRMYSNKDVRTFDFFVAIPGVVSEWDEKDLKRITEQANVRVETDEYLREVLLGLPCCTQRENGTGEGEPLNLVIIGGKPTLKAFISTGWEEAKFQKSFRTTFGAAYLYGRPPDVQFQKSRRRIDSINRVKLWISPIRYRGEVVLVGSVGRSIDPDVDAAVHYVVEDLATAGMVARFGKVGGVGEISRNSPRKNFANAPYWTDGYRVVLEVSEEPVELSDLDFFDWDWERRIRRGGDE